MKSFKHVRIYHSAKMTQTKKGSSFGEILWGGAKYLRTDNGVGAAIILRLALGEGHQHQDSVASFLRPGPPNDELSGSRVGTVVQ